MYKAGVVSVKFRYFIKSTQNEITTLASHPYLNFAVTQIVEMKSYGLNFMSSAPPCPKE
jgi:hypothetical protein